MELLQIDSIHGVARGSYLVLFSRLGPYEPGWLDELLESGRILEAWAHEACFAPIEECALHRRSLDTSKGWFMNRRQPPPTQGRGADARAPGARGGARPGPLGRLRATRGRRSGRWSWKREEEWLEAWFALGELITSRLVNFCRIYDLRRRVHPGAVALALPSAAEASRAMVERTVRALGVTQARWIHDYYRTSAPAPGRSGAARRFDYRLECYVPGPRRRYSYHALPSCGGANSSAGSTQRRTAPRASSR